MAELHASIADWGTTDPLPEEPLPEEEPPEEEPLEEEFE